VHGLLQLQHCRRAVGSLHSLLLPVVPDVSSKLLVFPQAPAAAAPAPAAAGKETAQERLKRLMQAQLNKAAQKDSLAVAQRKIQVCTGSDCLAAGLLLVVQDEMLLPGDAGWGALCLGHQGHVCVSSVLRLLLGCP
jgi:hypothetical protein